MTTMFLATVLAPRGGNRRPGWIACYAYVAILIHLTTALAGDTKDDPEARREVSELRWTVPYQAGKVPVVFVHGFLGSPINWAVMIDSLSADPSVREHFQLLTFEYDSLQSIPHSGRKLIAALHEARQRFDPEGRDAGFDRVILVGHSLGGLVAKAAALGSAAEPAAPGEPPAGAPRQPASPQVGRLIFVATPHRGSTADQGAMRSAAIWVARNFSLSSSQAVRTQGRSAAADTATSVDQLTWDHPLLKELQRAGAATGVPYHSIIATLGDPSAPEATDGIVAVASARLASARSELLVRNNHLCFQNPEVIGEVCRVLGEHVAGAVNTASTLTQRAR